MRIKTDTEFTTYSDGVCDIYTIDDNGEPINKYKSLGFTERVLGFNRFYAAAANQIAISKVIRIPKLDNIDTFDHVDINGKAYDIKLVQIIYDANPPSIDLTLQ